jgi:hypothetical protein
VNSSTHLHDGNTGVGSTKIDTNDIVHGAGSAVEGTDALQWEKVKTKERREVTNTARHSDEEVGKAKQARRA